MGRSSGQTDTLKKKEYQFALKVLLIKGVLIILVKSKIILIST
jgi:hypothetical protein